MILPKLITYHLLLSSLIFASSSQNLAKPGHSNISSIVIPKNNRSSSAERTIIRPKLSQRRLSTLTNKNKFHPTFGKTHFIKGFPHARFKHEQCTRLQEKLEYLIAPDGSVKRALFSPDDNIQATLINLIEHEQESIKIAVFSFTDPTIAHALMRMCAFIPVELITDPSAFHTPFHKIDQLQEQGVHVYIYNPKRNKAILGDKMHDKFILFGKNIHDKQLLWTGSSNFTKSAFYYNQENAVIFDELALIKQFNQQFNKLMQRSKRYRDITQ